MDVKFIATIDWSDEFLKFANFNSGILEVIGLLLPFVSIPKQLMHKEIVLEVDNLAVVFAWNKRYAKNDEILSIFIQTLHLIETVLPCKIYVHHVLRCSNPMSSLADALTRKATVPQNLHTKYREVKFHKPKTLLKKFINQPSIDWNFPLALADHVANCIRQ
jgi:NADH:ubiquinone oxidoreductase subunit K